MRDALVDAGAVFFIFVCTLVVTAALLTSPTITDVGAVVVLTFPGVSLLCLIAALKRLYDEVMR